MTTSLVADYTVTAAGSIFAISDRAGDVHPNTLQGFYARDTRFLSQFRLTIGDREPILLGSSPLSYALSSFYVVSPSTRSHAQGSLSIVRDRHVDQALHEDISVFNHSAAARTFLLKLRLDADFADLFEVRRGRFRKAGQVTAAEVNGELRLTYERDNFRRETRIVFNRPPQFQDRTAVFEITLKQREEWSVCVSVLPVIDSVPEAARCIKNSLGNPFDRRRDLPAPPLRRVRRERRNGALADPPALSSTHPDLLQSYSQAVSDLRALVVEPRSEGWYTLAAGLPWFMAVFGRDSIIASLQTKILGPELMLGTLRTLASLQATEVDPFRESQPGKIPHEVREGELSHFSEVPHSRYYGSVDSTPLFLILLGEAHQWTGDLEMARSLLPAAEAAIGWIDQYGDLDGDGFVEYVGRRESQLRNQCWKDSEDSISFADGGLARGPIAVAEVQGYVYYGKRRMAALYRLLGDEPRATDLEAQAQKLKKDFNDAFWMPEEGYYALALDGRNRQVDAIASNAGHCLWSGIVDEDKARHVAERLMAPDMFSGWGVRTMSSEMARYDPASYHNGSVWPHDNSIIAAGLLRYGFARECERLAHSLLETTAAMPNHRLPELFAGYGRRRLSFPVPYPSANSPQAWASGAVIYAIELLMKLRPEEEDLVSDAPRIGAPMSLSGVRYRNSRWDF